MSAILNNWLNFFHTNKKSEKLFPENFLGIEYDILIITKRMLNERLHEILGQS
jgi:hypothetical protein